MKYGQEAKRLFWAASYTSSASEFKIRMDKIEALNPECRRYLDALPADRWAQHASPFTKHPRYGHHSSNIAESINKEWLQLRQLPPYWLLIEVWEVMRSKFFARLYEQHGDDGDTTKTKFAREAEAVEAACQRLYKISPLSNLSASVLNIKNQKMYHVDLQSNTCTCTHFQDIRIPYRHAITAAERLKVPRYSDPRYTIEEHRKAYSGGF